MKYNVLQFSTSASGYAAKVVSTHETEDAAKVKYHSLLAALHNDADTQIAAVKIVTEYGYDVQGFFEVVDHTVKETATTETVTE